MASIAEVQATLAGHYADLANIDRQEEGLRLKRRETQKQIDGLHGYLQALEEIAAADNVEKK